MSTPKDWTGNSKSVFSTTGASSHSSEIRQEHDFYATHPSAIDALLPQTDLPCVIWEPCCGSGSLAKRLMKHGHNVLSSDLYPHGYGQTGVDFLQCDSVPKDCRAIVTNFPYSKLLPMTLHALDILPEGGLLCSFVRTCTLEGQNRYAKLYSKYPPLMILQFSKRVLCAKNGDFENTKSSAVAYCWIVWKKGYTGEPTLKWV